MIGLGNEIAVKIIVIQRSAMGTLAFFVIMVFLLVMTSVYGLASPLPLSIVDITGFKPSLVIELEQTPGLIVFKRALAFVITDGVTGGIQNDGLVIGFDQAVG